MHFCDASVVDSEIRGKRVALVGSGPGCLDNEPGFIDGHDVVARVNNFRLSPEAGTRTDCFYSFFGSSIRKTAAELARDGVRLCICKCPDAKFLESAWHRKRGKPNGVDFRYVYRDRANWWFCPTFVPSLDEFLRNFELLGKHVPTTGFSAILKMLEHEPASLYLTGFDGFKSGLHNVTERWRPGDPTDPIGHRPELELAWLAENIGRHPISVDRALAKALLTATGD